MQKHREVTKRPQKATKGHHGYKCHYGMTSISTKYLLENEKSPKTKKFNRIPKMEAKHRSPQCHWLPSTGFRALKIQILKKFTVRPSHIQSQNHLQKEWSNLPVSMSKCTNSCYMTHRVLKARMNYCINQNPGQKNNLQAKSKPSSY